MSFHLHDMKSQVVCIDARLKKKKDILSQCKVYKCSDPCFVNNFNKTKIKRKSYQRSTNMTDGKVVMKQLINARLTNYVK